MATFTESQAKSKAAMSVITDYTTDPEGYEEPREGPIAPYGRQRAPIPQQPPQQRGSMYAVRPRRVVPGNQDNAWQREYLSGRGPAEEQPMSLRATYKAPSGGVSFSGGPPTRPNQPQGNKSGRVNMSTFFTPPSAPRPASAVGPVPSAKQPRDLPPRKAKEPNSDQVFTDRLISIEGKVDDLSNDIQDVIKEQTETRRLLRGVLDEITAMKTTLGSQRDHLVQITGGQDFSKGLLGKMDQKTQCSLERISNGLFDIHTVVTALPSNLTAVPAGGRPPARSVSLAEASGDSFNPAGFASPAETLDALKTEVIVLASRMRGLNLAEFTRYVNDLKTIKDVTWARGSLLDYAENTAQHGPDAPGQTETLLKVRPRGGELDQYEGDDRDDDAEDSQEGEDDDDKQDPDDQPDPYQDEIEELGSRDVPPPQPGSRATSPAVDRTMMQSPPMSGGSFVN